MGVPPVPVGQNTGETPLLRKDEMTQLAQQPHTATTLPILRAQSLSKTFRMGDSVLQVLKGVDLSVRTGEFLAIEGRSGSGKSTLLHILGALDAADSGSVEFDGRDIAALSGAARSKLRNT